MTLSLILSNIKNIAIGLAIIAAIWFYKDYTYQKSENKRQTENISQQRKSDSLRFHSQLYTKEEIKEYLEYKDPELMSYLRNQNVKLNRIEKIITQRLSYSDNTSRSTDLEQVLKAIKQNKDIKVPVKDSTKCLVVSGYVAFKNDTLKLHITDRKFKNKSDVVAYWERNQWKFLGIKTRLFGKKKITVVIKDDCGRSETLIIDRLKK